MSVGAATSPIGDAVGDRPDRDRGRHLLVASVGGQLDQLVHQCSQLACLAFDIGQQPLARVGRQFFVALHDRHVRAQTGQRCAQLVPGVLHQVMLRALGPRQRGQHAVERLTEAARLVLAIDRYLDIEITRIGDASRSVCQSNQPARHLLCDHHPQQQCKRCEHHHDDEGAVQDAAQHPVGLVQRTRQLPSTVARADRQHAEPLAVDRDVASQRSSAFARGKLQLGVVDRQLDRAERRGGSVNRNHLEEDLGEAAEVVGPATFALIVLAVDRVKRAAPAGEEFGRLPAWHVDDSRRGVVQRLIDLTSQLVAGGEVAGRADCNRRAHRQCDHRDRQFEAQAHGTTGFATLRFTENARCIRRRVRCGSASAGLRCRSCGGGS